MEYGKYLMTLGGLLALGLIYEKFKQKYVEDEESLNYERVRKYLVTDSSLARSKKPLLWIHLSYDQNARWWQSFYSRNTDDLNQQYLFSTIKSIIERCGSCFNICIIDDETFSNIIPGWTINMSRCAEPILGKIRKLALARILKYYGGLIVPPSFLCMKNLADMYYTQVSDGKPIVGTLIDRSRSSYRQSYLESPGFLGAMKDCHVIDNYIRSLELQISGDCTAESDFLGEDGLWWHDEVSAGRARAIDPMLLGQADTDGKQVTIERLMGNTYVDFAPTIIGVVLPQREILVRSSFNWFARMSTCQAMESDTIVGKLLLTSGH